ncbi:MAG TPA: SDR family NAD(P)-dependent oxidoreductase [Anaerolineales bacterium]|nr:SDR family NAD(P)-dependent oxidoreductase [Anaerolineales bacterium]
MRWFVTGGAGFIGANTVRRLLDDGHEVIVYDNLSRPGSEKNLEWLRQRGDGLTFLRGDVRQAEAVRLALATLGPVDIVLHFAAQVAVTTSVTDPRLDFDINAHGTFNLLEAIRSLGLDPVVLFTSTNKVYGALEEHNVVAKGSRYVFERLPRGVDEAAGLDFYSPYGCSKGAADQYVHDYHRIYGMQTIVFRNSCIYGPRQFGIEDQGWLAWFVIAAILGRPITIYGDGRQVRDVLFVEDLIDAMLGAVDKPDVTAGQVYNIGGGPDNALAVWTEFGPLLEKLIGRPVPVEHADWRPGDQKVYISDVSKAERHFGWRPKVGVEEGIGRLVDWVRENRQLFEPS